MWQERGDGREGNGERQSEWFNSMLVNYYHFHARTQYATELISVMQAKSHFVEKSWVFIVICMYVINVTFYTLFFASVAVHQADGNAKNKEFYCR